MTTLASMIRRLFSHQDPVLRHYRLPLMANRWSCWKREFYPSTEMQLAYSTAPANIYGMLRIYSVTQSADSCNKNVCMKRGRKFHRAKFIPQPLVLVLCSLKAKDKGREVVTIVLIYRYFIYFFQFFFF